MTLGGPRSGSLSFCSVTGCGVVVHATSSVDVTTAEKISCERVFIFVNYRLKSPVWRFLDPEAEPRRSNPPHSGPCVL